ncbi:MAG: hypothetical protein ABSF95_09670 [Verrucomicrobiota bacterium]
MIGLKGQASPYRLTDQRLLPKFGLDKNPLCSTVRPGHAPGAEGGPSERPSATGTGEAPAKEAQPAPPPTGAWAQAAPGSKLRRTGRRLTDRLQALFVRSEPGPVKSAIPRLTRPPVQGELSLERVRVVCNDLSDSGPQIVQIRWKAASASPTSPALAKAAPCGPAGGRGVLGLFSVNRT